VKTVIKQSERQKAFTIVELLTVMSIIIILIGLLVPSLNMVKRYARRVKQKAQFHSIDVAMEIFNTEEEGYPDSAEKDDKNESYCGAMKLCEAMMGQDLIGFHPDSYFRRDGTTGPIGTSTKNLYDKNIGGWTDSEWTQNLKSRRGPYLQPENANAYRMQDLYSDNPVPFEAKLFVMCDVYSHVRNRTTGKKNGMPILYYKANTSRTKCPHWQDSTFIGDKDDTENIYNYKDNLELIDLGLPWDTTGLVHPMATSGTTSSGTAADPRLFYDNENQHDRVYNPKIDVQDGRPNCADSYILLSAGFDGEYGTPDDVFNFGD
jgi:type II secretory pathway pseudopilin PulG